MDPVDTDVIVVGAGPVGLMLAGELRLGGARTTVLERLTAPTTESRASTLHARTMEFFDQRGLLDRLGEHPVQRGGHFGGIPLDFSGLPTRFPGQYKVPQAEVEVLLGQRAVRLGAVVRREYEVFDLRAEPDRVRVRAHTPAGMIELSARYVVGCDGETSAVRTLAGIAMSGVDGAHELLRADVAGIEIADRRFERRPAGLAIASRFPGGLTRIMVSEFGRKPGYRAGPPDFDEICAVWERVAGEDIRHGVPVWRNAFDDTSRLAERYRSGRILLAGDAAHLTMPSGGQAINLGLQDAANLGWKLAAAATGPSPEDLLDTYHAERHAVGRRVLDNIRAQGLLLLGGPEVEQIRAVLAELVRRPVVNDRLAGMVAGVDVHYGAGPPALVGAVVPHVALTVGPSRTSTTELLRSGRGVLLDLSGDAERHGRLRDRLTPWRARLDLVAAAPPDDDAFGGADLVLLRPDGYLAWAGDRRADPIPPVAGWFGRDPRVAAPVVPDTSQFSTMGDSHGDQSPAVGARG